MNTTATTPHNPTTGKEYTGGNVQKLIDCMDSNPAFASGAFATFRQWLTVGRVVMKGQKTAARLLACKTDRLEGVTAKDVAKGAPEGAATIKRGFLKGFSVFAYEQTAPLEGAAPVPGAVVEGEEEHGTPAEAEDKPEPGKLYSLSRLARTGTWGASEYAAPPVVPIAVPEPVKPAPVVKRGSVHTDDLRDKADRCQRDADACHADRQTNTAKRLAQAMGKRLEGDRLKRQAQMLRAVAAAIDGNAMHGMNAFSTRELVAKVKEASLYETRHTANGYHSYLIEDTSKPQHNLSEHRALRALIDPRTMAAEAEKSAQVQALAELRHSDFPGFFPTPAAVVAVMLEQAGDLKGKQVLEPSAGKGDLVAAALAAGAQCVHAFEIVPKLALYVAKFSRPARGQVCMVQQADFLTELPASEFARVDVVLMNPPFEEDAAPKHVLHALGWLKEGGRLIAVMPANWAEKGSADHLLRMLDDLGHDHMEMELEEGAFSGADAFRQTGVRVSLLIINAKG